MESTKPLLAQWREANHLASLAEQALFEASLLYLRGHGPEPTEENVKAVHELRAAAQALFKTALAQIDSYPQEIVTLRSAARINASTSDGRGH